MLQLDPIKAELPGLARTLAEVGESLKLSELRQQIQEYEEKTMDPGFWDDPESAQSLLKKKSSLESKVNRFDSLDTEISDLSEMIELAEEMEDEDEANAIVESFGELQEKVDAFKLETLLNGKYDHNSAVLSLHAGAGGVEAMDWAEMLFRMYTRWAERKGYKVNVVDLQDDTEAGIKSATFMV